MKNIIKHVGLLVAMLLANNLLAQDTIIQFIYDSGKGNLTVDILNAKGISFGFLQSDTANNATAKELFKSIEKSVDPHYFFYNEDSITVSVNFFDSSDIKKIRFYKEGNCNFTGKQLIPHFVYTNTINKASGEESGTEENDSNVSLFLLVGLAVLLLIGVCLIIFTKWKKETIEAPKTPSRPEEKKDLSIKIVKPQISSTRIIGLEHVREHENEYYLLDIQQQYTDTAIHKIYFHHTAVKKTYDFFKTFLESADRTPETGCYLVGCREYADESHKTYNISVEDIVEPGDDIKPDEYSFSFGYKIGSYLDMKLRNLREKTGSDYVHTV